MRRWWPLGLRRCTTWNALIADQNSAWLGMGIAFGLGILSKYTLACWAGGAAVCDPGPGLASLAAPSAALPCRWACPAAVLPRHHLEYGERLGLDYVPVKPGQGGSEDQFAAHLLFLHLMVLLTPVGLLAAAMTVWPGAEPDRNAFAQASSIRTSVHRLAAGSVCSSRHFRVAAVSLDRTDMARTAADHGMVDGPGRRFQILSRVRAAWKPTIAVCIFLYALVLHYVVLGIPGIPYGVLSEHYFWREATKEIEQVVAEVRQETGKSPLW